MEIEVEFGKPWEVGRVRRFRRLSLDALSNQDELLRKSGIERKCTKKIPPNRVVFLAPECATGREREW